LSSRKDDKSFKEARDFLLTDKYYKELYMKMMGAAKAEDLFYFLRERLAVQLAKINEDKYNLLLCEYYYGDSFKDLSKEMMIKDALNKLVYPGEIRLKEINLTYETMLSVKNTKQDVDGNIIVNSSMTWSSLGGNIYRTVLVIRKIDGKDVIIPIAHEIVGRG